MCREVVALPQLTCGQTSVRFAKGQLDHPVHIDDAPSEIEDYSSTERNGSSIGVTEPIGSEMNASDLRERSNLW